MAQTLEFSPDLVHEKWKIWWNFYDLLTSKSTELINLD